MQLKSNGYFTKNNGEMNPISLLELINIVTTTIRIMYIKPNMQFNAIHYV